MTEHDHAVYVAADYAKKHLARQVAERLEELGIGSTARWYSSQPAYKDNGLGGELEGEDAVAAARVAQEDMDDIQSANLFVQLTTGELHRGGRTTELGYAIALKQSWPERLVVCVGPREHAFHYHPLVAHVETVDQLMAFLRGWTLAMDS